MATAEPRLMMALLQPSRKGRMTRAVFIELEELNDTLVIKQP